MMQKDVTVKLSTLFTVSALFAMLVMAVGVIGGIAYAYTDHVVGGGVVLRGGSNNTTIDVDGDGNWAGEVSYYGQITKGGVFSGNGTMINSTDHIWEDRAEAAVGRMTSVGGEAANAWIQSSGNAKVLAQYDGSVIITLGD